LHMACSLQKTDAAGTGEESRLVVWEDRCAV
jgi:hypothetical protein